MATPEEIRAQLWSFRNVVCEASLSCAFPSLIIPSLLCQARAEDKLFPAAVARLLQTTCTISIFSGGKVMVMGSSSSFNSRLALVFLCDLINRTIPGMNTRVDAFHVVNRVASVKLGFDIDVEKFALDWKSFGLWEKTSFPGMKVEMTDLEATFVVFTKLGKINIAGVRSASWLPRIAQRMAMFSPYRIGGT